MTESSSASSSSAPQQFVLTLGDLRKPLESGRSYTIGKENSCDLRLGHGTVSPTHCRVQVTETGVVVHDLNSLAGTRIDGEPVMDGPWKPGQVLEVGDIRIELGTRTVVATPLAYAAAGAAAAGVGAAGLVAHRHEPSFGDVMAYELKRAPWFGLSIVVHAILLLAVWFFAEQKIPPGSTELTISLEDAEDEQDIDEEEVEEETEEEEVMEDQEFVETEVEESEEQLFFNEADIPDTDHGLGDTNDLMRATGAGLNDILKAGKKNLSHKFTEGIRGLRKNGLEIVFVFDSTGSMGTVLQAAKDRLAKMTTVLLELVPYARIGVITYRDHGVGEEYLTRKVALSRDFYRSINFLQLIYAGGGGDEPEAVYDALREAIHQKWSPTARRLVILIGDAPPHKKSAGKISSMVKSFTRDGRSHVHAIITQPSGDSEIAKETTRTFKRIARDGRGEALAFKDEGQILKAVMTLAFGRKESRSVDVVYRIAEESGKTARRNSMNLAAGKNPKRLRLEFKKSVVSHDLVKAILLKPSRKTLTQLVDFVSSGSFPSAGKHAASYILQKTLHLDEPPVDPITNQSLSKRRARTLKKYIERKIE